MKPHHQGLFNLGLLTGLAGAWLYVYSIDLLTVAPMADQYCCGVDFGGPMFHLAARIVGLVALALLVLSFVLKPNDKKPK